MMICSPCLESSVCAERNTFQSAPLGAPLGAFICAADLHRYAMVHLFLSAVPTSEGSKRGARQGASGVYTLQQGCCKYQRFIKLYDYARRLQYFFSTVKMQSPKPLLPNSFYMPLLGSDLACRQLPSDNGCL